MRNQKNFVSSSIGLILLFLATQGFAASKTKEIICETVSCAPAAKEYVHMAVAPVICKAYTGPFHFELREKNETGVLKITPNWDVVYFYDLFESATPNFSFHYQDSLDGKTILLESKKGPTKAEAYLRLGAPSVLSLKGQMGPDRAQISMNCQEKTR